METSHNVACPKEEEQQQQLFKRPHPVNSGKTGIRNVSGAGESGTSVFSGAGETGQCSATGSWKKNVCLTIIPVIVKRTGQHNEIVMNALLDHGSHVKLCDMSLMEKLQVSGHPKEFLLTAR